MITSIRLVEYTNIPFTIRNIKGLCVEIFCLQRRRKLSKVEPCLNVVYNDKNMSSCTILVTFNPVKYKVGSRLLNVYDVVIQRTYLRSFNTLYLLYVTFGDIIDDKELLYNLLPTSYMRELAFIKLDELLVYYNVKLGIVSGNLDLPLESLASFYAYMLFGIAVGITSLDTSPKIVNLINRCTYSHVNIMLIEKSIDIIYSVLL